ncbi:hypothetical protein PCG10_000193 [Penicillium crustosum]|uniref:Cellulose-binding protein n=1 Tax=Penicillium crustosum TaxID=36656 RepID=A0A9P5GVP1_PENCR|nr:uncharacterized protein N7487_007786 [Penicillium crustosum]KAF7530684.1 hypothetical protein PCG10_000193 [Penicillium crustosum]KAJ5401890.1 hypothetical protein N7487_007786 [Penicillium crustosum]
MLRVAVWLCLGTLLATLTLCAQSTPQCHQKPSSKPRLFLLSDIANEPDDAQSLVRLLLYSNELQIEGLVATTSFWLNDTTRPDQMRGIVQGYKEVLDNLKTHASGWPEPEHLFSLIASGSTIYGMEGVGNGRDSEGSEMLVNAVDASDEPLWVPLWGGANTLAQALWHVNATRPADIDLFVSKLRVYSISDQDNAGPWIRRNWPNLFYISSVHAFNRYGNAAWGGDSPSLLYLIPNGLSDPEQPEWGSWGGRYGPVAWGEGHFADSIDTLVDDNGKTMMGSQVTVWRWREAFQNDFKSRMQWTIRSHFEQASHAPVAIVNGSAGREVLQYVVLPEQNVVLDASKSCNPDDHGALSFKWWQYLEPSSNLNTPKRDVTSLNLQQSNTATVTIEIPSAETLMRAGRGVHAEADKHLHIILEVSNGGQIAYRRVILTIKGNTSSEKTEGREQEGHDEL